MANTFKLEMTFQNFDKNSDDGISLKEFVDGLSQMMTTKGKVSDVAKVKMSGCSGDKVVRQRLQQRRRDCDHSVNQILTSFLRF